MSRSISIKECNRRIISIMPTVVVVIMPKLRFTNLEARKFVLSLFHRLIRITCLPTTFTTKSKNGNQLTSNKIIKEPVKVARTLTETSSTKTPINLKTSKKPALIDSVLIISLNKTSSFTMLLPKKWTAPKHLTTTTQTTTILKMMMTCMICTSTKKTRTRNRNAKTKLQACKPHTKSPATTKNSPT